jgi:hypothetical protein
MSLAITIGLPTATTVRRAPKELAANQTFGQADPYAMLMACWVDYMRVPDLHLSPRSMSLVGDAPPDATVGEAQYIADLKLGESVNAMVDSLVMIHRWAIYKSQGISTVWRFPNANYETVLLEARDELEKKLSKHVATRLYFA